MIAFVEIACCLGRIRREKGWKNRVKVRPGEYHIIITGTEKADAKSPSAAITGQALDSMVEPTAYAELR